MKPEAWSVWLAVSAASVALAGCAGAAPPAAGASPASVIAPANPDVELRDAKSAVVNGQPVAFDGVAEGLAWPALAQAVKRARGDHAPLVIAAGRDVPLAVVLRAVWTLRDADVRVQTPDDHGSVRVLDFRPRPDAAPETGSHLAVFVAANGDLRVATPGGPHAMPGPDAAGTLASTLVKEREDAPIRYVAFGADAKDAPWSRVFDVAAAIDRDKSAGDARYVLGEPLP